MGKEPEQQPAFTQEQFMEFMRMMMEENRSATLEAIKEFKKPDEYTLQKQEEQRKRELEQRVTRMQSSIAEERASRLRQFSCQHLKTSHGIKNPDHAFMGQVNNDGFFRPICGRCQKTFPKMRATDEQIRNGLALNNVPSLSAKVLLSWHIRTMPDCKDCADPRGYCAKQQLKELEQGFLNPMPEVLPDGKIRAEEAYGVSA